MKAAASRPQGRVVPHQPTRLQRILAWTLHVAFFAHAHTQRWKIDDPQDAQAVVRQGPVIFAVWHNRLAHSIAIYRRLVRQHNPNRRLAGLVSASRDGALLAAILQAGGAHAVRGSTSRRGPQALLEFTSRAQQGFDLAITPDGPRGPRYRVQPGVIAVAKATGLPIIPISPNYAGKLCLKSWDAFQVPYPFTTCRIRLGPVLRIAPGETSLEAARAELEQTLGAITED